ncbi:hypothetical protein ACFYUK_19110 [Nonomuraea wenchangensis]
MDANPTAILQELLRARGLSVTRGDGGAVVVGNPLHGRINAVVITANGRYLTDYGYELGEQGDELATANRLAFLLSAPTVTATQPADAPPFEAHHGI